MSDEPQPEPVDQTIVHKAGRVLIEAAHTVEDAIVRVKDQIAKLMADNPAEVAAVEAEVKSVAEAGLVAAEPAIVAVAEGAVAAGVQAGAVAIEEAAPVLAPAVEAGAAAIDKAADHVIESEFHAPPQEAK